MEAVKCTSAAKQISARVGRQLSNQINGPELTAVYVHEPALQEHHQTSGLH